MNGRIAKKIRKVVIKSIELYHKIYGKRLPFKRVYRAAKKAYTRGEKVI